MAAPIVAVKAGAFLAQNWKKLLPIIVAIFLMIIMIPASLLSVFFPASKPDKTNLYTLAADDYELNWMELLAFDTVRYDNDLKKADPDKSVYEFYGIDYKEYEQVEVSVPKQKVTKDKKGNKIVTTVYEKELVWQIKKSGVISGYNAIYTYLIGLGYNGDLTIKDITSFLNNLGASEKYDFSVIKKTYDDVISIFDESHRQWALDLLYSLKNSDIKDANSLNDISYDDLKEYPPGNSNIPYFNQADKRWALESYGESGTIRSSGCGPTSLAMVIAGITGRSDITPKIIADWSVSTGHRIEGEGSSWSLMPDGGSQYGLRVENVSRRNPKIIIDALSKGYPVIVSMGVGHFTSGGHFMVLRGLTADGKILVNDPISVSRTNQAWDASIIFSESSTLGGFSGSPFWIFKKA